MTKEGSRTRQNKSKLDTAGTEIKDRGGVKKMTIERNPLLSRTHKRRQQSTLKISSAERETEGLQERDEKTQRITRLWRWGISRKNKG